MKTVKIKVKNCRNCPFVESAWDSNYTGSTLQYANCLAPSEIHKNYKVDSYFKKYSSPKWCPLKSNKLIIEHEK